MGVAGGVPGSSLNNWAGMVGVCKYKFKRSCLQVLPCNLALCTCLFKFLLCASAFCSAMHKSAYGSSICAPGAQYAERLCWYTAPAVKGRKGIQLESLKKKILKETCFPQPELNFCF